MIVPQVDYAGRLIRQYVDVMEAMQMLKAHMSGMINCKGGNGTPSEVVLAFRRL
jgi:hypothetical protein